MASGATKNKILEQKTHFGAKMTFCQSLMVTDDALKVDYANVIFVDPAAQIDKA